MTLFPELLLTRSARPPRTGKSTPVPRVTPAALDTLWTPAPTPPPERISVDIRNPWGEWRNPSAPHLRAIADALETLPPDYLASAGYIRRNQPHSISTGLAFWRAPISRAHILNALLTRQGRTIKRVEQDLGLDQDDMSDKLRRWHIEFGVAATRGTVQDPSDATTYSVQVIERLRDGTARLRLDGYAHHITARYDTRAGLWLALHPIEITPEKLISYPVAATLAGVSERLLLAAIPPQLHTDNDQPLIHLTVLESRLPRAEWRTTLERARTLHNPCRCAYWDDHRRTCHLGNHLPQPGTAPYHCEDHA